MRMDVSELPSPSHGGTLSPPSSHGDHNGDFAITLASSTNPFSSHAWRTDNSQALPDATLSRPLPSLPPFLQQEQLPIGPAPELRPKSLSLLLNRKNSASSDIKEKQLCSWRERLRKRKHTGENLQIKEEGESLNGMSTIVIPLRATPNAARQYFKSTPLRPKTAKTRSSSSLQVSLASDSFSTPERQAVSNVSFDRLPASFCKVDAVQLAMRLVGKHLRKEDVVLRITEVEAYTEGDTACHARFGKTGRTAPLFGPGGHAYVYLCYGLHNMLNITADEEGIGAACLIRACQPVHGIATIQLRRGLQIEGPNLLTGPGKVGQALGLTPEWSHHPLYEEGGLELLDGPPPPEGLLAGPRIGIDYASEEDKSSLWRFAAAGTKWVSSSRKGLVPVKETAF